MKNLIKNKPKGDIIAQLENLKLWSQNPKEFYAREARKNKLKAFVKSEDPVPRNTKEKKQIKVVKKPLPKDWQPKYLNGNVIDITPLINDPYWLIKPEKPEDEDTSIPIEEKIRRFAQAKQNNTEQVGVASLMRLKKFVG